MNALGKLIAAHPLSGELPYSALTFSRTDGSGTPLYRVEGDDKERGAEKSLRKAFKKHGGKCFYCERKLKSRSSLFTIDHVRPHERGGSEFLFNLVVACLYCNRLKDRKEIVDFKPKSAARLLKQFDNYLTRCFQQLAK